MRAMVTGAAGFIGSRLAERLLEEGHSVVGVDRFSDYYEPQRKRANLSVLGAEDRFQLVEGDLNALDLAELLDGVEVVFHLAAQPGVRTSWGAEFGVYLDDNVLATQRLLEACRASPVERIVVASSSSIYGDAERFPTSEQDRPRPISPYGVTKLAAEHLCWLYHAAMDVPAVALRYFTIFGPRQRPDMAFARFIDAALEGRPIEVYGDGMQSRDFTFVDDAVSATVAAASQGRSGSAYNVAGGTQATVLDAIEILSGLLGRPQVNHLPAVAGDARKTGADTTRARSDLDYQPRVSLEDGLARQVEFERRQRSG